MFTRRSLFGLSFAGMVDAEPVQEVRNQVYKGLTYQEERSIVLDCVRKAAKYIIENNEGNWSMPFHAMLCDAFEGEVNLDLSSIAVNDHRLVGGAVKVNAYAHVRGREHAVHDYVVME